MHYKVLLTSICVFTSISICETYKILLVFPFPFKSHSILGESFVNILLKAGHEVSYITPYPVAEPHPSLKQIVIKPYTYPVFQLKTLGVARPFKDIFNQMHDITYSAITDDNIQQLMEETSQSLDLVIAEWMLNDVYSGFSAVFNCPYIWFFIMHNDYEMSRLIHEPPNPLLTANIRTNNVPPLSFLEKTYELFYLMYFKFLVYFFHDPMETKAYNELYGPILAKRGRSLPPYEEVRYNASLLFSNSHFTVRDSSVMPLNYRTIGGLHISDASQPLNQELLNIIEDTKSDILLFCLGSYLKSEELPSTVKRDLLTMFSKLNYTILWKIDEDLKDLPSNVKTFPWIPVQRVLAHAKCVLFITHGGILSLTESVYYGVPIVGVPVFGDQIVNMKTAVKRGVAKMVPMSYKLADDLKKAIEDVLNNPRYKENMKSLSALYHDRPLSPGAELVYWVEHVIATRGAPHLRSPALLVPWYQKYFIDLAALLVAFLIAFVYLINKVFKCIINKVKVRLHRNHKKSL